MTWVLIYISIGLLFAFYDKDARSIIFWPLELDIHLRGFVERLRIRREERRQIAEVIRNRKLSVVAVTVYHDGTFKIIANHNGEISAWYGCGSTWCQKDGTQPSEWFEKWLTERWQEAHR